MKNYDVILWDVDGTLLNFDKTEDYALTNSFEKFQLEYNPSIKELYQQINKALWKQLEEQLITKDQVIYGRFEQLFQKLTINGISSAEFQDYYQNVLANTYFIQDDSVSLCRKLQGKVKQYIVTNGVKTTQETKLSLSGLDQIMDGVFISEVIGYPKPDKRFFDAAFNQMIPADKERILIIGDSISSDICGGISYGIKTCWYNPEQNSLTGSEVPDYIITNLWEIEDIL